MGTSLVVNQPAWLQEGFMHIKLTLVFLLYLYHFSLQHIFNLIKKDIVKYSSQQLRFWNEVATLFLISIVFIIVLKDTLSMLWGITGLIALTFLLIAGIKLYRKYRNEK